jgi:hypothetical protein
MSWCNGLCTLPSEPQGPGPPPTPRAHCLHYADANDAEISVNTQFFSKIEEIYNPKTKVELRIAIDALVDFIIEGRKCERLEERGATIETTGIDFTIKDLLIHTPVQYWPLPHINHCPCAFCDERLEPNRMEFH